MTSFSDKVQLTYNRMADAQIYRAKEAIKSGQPVIGLIQRQKGLAVVLYVLKPGGDVSNLLDYFDPQISPDKVLATRDWIKRNYPKAIIDLKDY